MKNCCNETKKNATPIFQIDVLLLGQKGLDRKHLEETARWFDRFPGPIKIQVEKRPVELELNSDGEITWDEVFSVLESLRSEKQLPSSTFMALLTHSPNELNWYAAQDDQNMRNGFGHVADFSWVTSAPPSVISSHFILKGILNALITEAGLNWEDYWHMKPRGCFFDFCAQKADLNLKLRTADICGDCMEVFRRIGIPDSLLVQTLEIMDNSRPLALNTKQYRRMDDHFARWPFPVAVTRHKIVQATNPLLKFLLLLDHFDSLVRYFYLTREIMEQRTPELDDRPSLGWWVDKLAHSLKGQDLYRKVITIAQQEKIVSLRNEMKGHGYMTIDPGLYEQEAQSLEAVITRIENELMPFFESHHLLIPRKIEPQNGVYVVEGEKLMGSHLLHPPFQVKLSGDPISAGLDAMNQVYVSDNKMQRFYRISPYIQSTVCPTCLHPRILVTDGGDQFIDVFMGHRVRIS